MKYKFIRTYSQFVLNETLKTHDIDLTILNVSKELSSLGYNFGLNKIIKNNTITLTLYDFCYTFNVYLILEHLNTLFIDRHGWFPSYMIINYLSGIIKPSIYNEDTIIKGLDVIKEIEITYEPKFDIEKADISKFLYHLSIQEFEKEILKKGIVPKSKSKESKHFDRIYLCIDEDDCYKLIPTMKLHYLKTNPYKSKINDKWIIYKISTNGLDIKLYKDPNYVNGYYCIDNIPISNIEILEKEK